MAYCTQADIVALELTVNELIDLADDHNTGNVNASQVTAAITKADAEIDAYCQAQYTVPFSPTPEIVKGWSATLAAFILYRNRTKPTTIIDRYNKVMSWLKAISKGDAQIPGETAAGYTAPASTTPGVARTFRRTQVNAASVVLGTDNKTYTCTASHTAEAANKPATGADYASYWIEEGKNGATWVDGAHYYAEGRLVLEPGTMSVW